METKMRVVVMEFMSLDGVVQAPGGPTEDTSGGFRHGGWSMKFFDPEVMGAVVEEVGQKSEALLQGRRTYQVSAEAWPERSGGFADWINNAQKYVVSDTLTPADVAAWNPTTIIRGADLLDEVSALRTLGGEKTLFPTDGEAREFELVSAQTAKTGVQVCRYRLAG
jgi:dihydrofolate reductase